MCCGRGADGPRDNGAGLMRPHRGSRAGTWQTIRAGGIRRPRTRRAGTTRAGRTTTHGRRLDSDGHPGRTAVARAHRPAHRHRRAARGVDRRDRHLLLRVRPSSLALIQILASLTYAPFLNSFFALGEEIGWRGYLYPALRERFSIVQTHVLLGLIWSLWHLPINLQGYNYGLSYFAYPVLGVVAMFLFCFSLGILLSWLLAKTGSIWASALFHGEIGRAHV